MGIGQLRCHVLDVNDLEVAEAFWSEVTGIPVIPSAFPGRYSYLGQEDPWRHEVILHLVPGQKGPDANRAHVDIWVRDIDVAVSQIEAIGGSLKREPVIYPRPGAYAGEAPLLDWSVMQDPFGNEFCLVRVLTREESEAVERAAASGQTGTTALRVAAGRTTPKSPPTSSGGE